MTVHMYVAPDAAGGGTGLSWAQAWTTAEWVADITNNASPDDIYYLKGGDGTMDANYTLTGHLNADTNNRIGNSVNPIRVIGVKSGTTAEPPTFSDWAFGNARPFIECNGKSSKFENYWELYNIGAYVNSAGGFRADIGCLFWNCYCLQYSATGGRPAFNIPSIEGHIVNCEGLATNGKGGAAHGTAISLGTQNISCVNCYTHDSVTGILTNSYCTLSGNLVADCTTGVEFTVSRMGIQLHGNTIYGCGTGIKGYDSVRGEFLGNIIAACTSIGADWNARYDSNIWDYNNWHGNNSDGPNITKGVHATALDPQFVDAANGDFRTGRNMRGIGAGLLLGVEVDSSVDCGAWQSADRMLVHPGMAGGMRA